MQLKGGIVTDKKCVTMRKTMEKLCGDCVFPQNLHTKKLGEITAFYALYTEDTLKSLTKPPIIDLFLKIQEHTNSAIFKLTDEIKN